VIAVRSGCPDGLQTLKRKFTTFYGSCGSRQTL